MLYFPNCDMCHFPGYDIFTSPTFLFPIKIALFVRFFYFFVRKRLVLLTVGFIDQLSIAKKNENKKKLNLCDDNIERKRYEAAPDLRDDPVATNEPK